MIVLYVFASILVATLAGIVCYNINGRLYAFLIINLNLNPIICRALTIAASAGIGVFLGAIAALVFNLAQIIQMQTSLVLALFL